MDDHYQTLGISKTATQEEIKSAYRKLAAKHHPDRGGDTATFQKIQAAYNIIGDPAKRSEYDNPRSHGFNFQGGGVPPGFEDIFRNLGGFGDIFGQRHTQRRNLILNLQTNITLEEAFEGKELVANVQLPSGREQVINIKIPEGIVDGTVLRLKEIGDDSVMEIPRGDIHLTVHVQPHAEFERQGDDLIKNIKISAFDAMLGTTNTITTLDQKTLNINIPPGTQPGTVLGIQGHGMPNMRDHRFKGRLLIKIDIVIPNNLTQRQKELLEQARA